MGMNAIDAVFRSPKEEVQTYTYYTHTHKLSRVTEKHSS